MLSPLNEELKTINENPDLTPEERAAQTQAFMQAHPEYLELTQQSVQLQAQIAALRLEEETLTPEQLEEAINKLNSTLNAMILEANDTLIQVTEE